MLWVLSLTAWLGTQGWARTPTLGEAARLGPMLFLLLTLVQLALFLFFAALSSASAVAQEKDRRTFILLLMTDLRNHEIVLGKLLGSLLPILLLLAATVPLLMLLVLLGGVSVVQVVQAELVVAATALAAGSLGGLVALWRDRTFQALALTTLLLVLYLCLVHGLGVLPWLIPGLSEQTIQTTQSWLEPFLALLGVLDPTGELAPGLPVAYGFTAAMLLLSLLLNLVGIVRLRVWNPSGEPIQQREAPEDEAAPDTQPALAGQAVGVVYDPRKTVVTGAGGLAVQRQRSPDEDKGRASAHAAPGKVRKVSDNPILWREIFTRAYGRRPLLVKTAYFIVLALICYSALAPLLGHGERVPYAAAWGLIPVGVLSLLLVTAQAVTAITSERDTGALDLLLVTDLTPGEFIFGKLGGICWNVKEYLLPPLILAGVYGWSLCLAPPRGHPELAEGMNFSAFVCVTGASLVLLAFAMVLGIHVALRTQSSRVAITHALSTIFFLTVGTLVCIGLILINGRFEYQWSSFVFFVVAGVGGLWWVLSGDRPSSALNLASWLCPFGVLYAIMNILVGRPGSQETADPLASFLVIVVAFGFTIAAMLVPLLSEFDVAMGRTTGGAD
jgi:ABC-type transport system involved in multi-copper enzyme maturation permease subunit